MESQSKFNGGLLGYIGIRLLAVLIIIFTLGIATPWAICMEQKWIADHTEIDGKQMIFDGTGAELLGKGIIWFLLAIITWGIFALWIPLKFQAWKTKHTHLVWMDMYY